MPGFCQHARFNITQKLMSLMTEEDNNHVEILFRFFSEVMDEETVEHLWALIVDQDKGLYQLDCIPFYAAAASGDVVFAEFDDTEQALTYRKTIEFSGNSTVQVVLLDTSHNINTIRNTFNDLGCFSEQLNNRYFVMEIPADNDYSLIRQKLTELEEKEIIGYAEPILSNRHSY